MMTLTFDRSIAINPVPFSPPDIMVNMGAFGEVECPRSGVQPGLQPDDKVTVAGRVNAAATAAA